MVPALSRGRARGAEGGFPRISWAGRSRTENARSQGGRVLDTRRARCSAQVPVNALFFRRLALVLALTLTFAASACAGPTFIVQQYAGPVRSRETIATLRVNGADSVRLATLDDEDMNAPLVEDGRLHVELLPGRHALSVRDAKAPSERPVAMAFVAEAGKVYRVAFTPEPRIFEVDRGTDAPGADVTSPVASRE